MSSAQHGNAEAGEGRRKCPGDRPYFDARRPTSQDIKGESRWSEEPKSRRVSKGETLRYPWLPLARPRSLRTPPGAATCSFQRQVLDPVRPVFRDGRTYDQF